MADVFPPRDLPGRSEEWGRKVEDRIEAGESSETQLVQKVDNGLRATAGQLAVIANQLEATASVLDFLTSQGDFDEVINYWEIIRDPVDNASVTWLGFNSDYDPSITVTAPDSGTIRVDLSGHLTAVSIAWRSDEQPSLVQSDTHLGFDVVQGASTVQSPDIPNSLLVTSYSFGFNATTANVLSVSGFYWVSGLTPGDVYQFRARRGYRGRAQNSPEAANSQQAFAVNNAKMTTTRMGPA